MKIDQGFLPILGASPKVLILGSMPSVKSLEQQQYYGNPQNAFWWIMSELFGFNVLEPYETRINYLIDKKVAVWDVIQACYRPGSLDSAIDTSTIQANNFSALLTEHATIKLVIFNGQAAQKIFKKHVLQSKELGGVVSGYTGEYLVMPSTSPANAATSRAMKLKKWRALNAYL